ncbi:hypothetical protein QBC38DRAFT_150660 [Podospora fimiseda]|uniref:Extracellular serine-rich protein n=1 Tax=Podospora fimiseda TaxID=252190 RepID=A0AAN7BS45_9PEZI|nr:hypothetical protein QBC38DRAFT_150660 [Podospora fimiseda]
MLSSFLLTGLLAIQATAIQFNVSVGRNGLTFEPNEIRAARDDIIEFRFWPRNHSVVAGRFNEACVPAPSGAGFYSGFLPTPADTINPQVFRIRINNSDPIVFYCSQNNGQHCKNGMFGIINPTMGGASTLAGYRQLALQAGNATSPSGGPFGGQFAANPNTVPPAPAATTVTVTASGSAATPTETDGDESSTSGTSTGSAASSTPSGGAVALGAGGSPFAGLVVAGAAALLFV